MKSTYVDAWIIKNAPIVAYWSRELPRLSESAKFSAEAASRSAEIAQGSKK